MSKPAHSADELCKRLGYQFRDIALLELACVHKSYGNENRSAEPLERRDNERLEFLGDAVLDFVVSHVLLETFPTCAEGDLSKLRAGLVNERSLAKIAREFQLGDYLLLGKGEEQTGGREKESILASMFEAVIAAIYRDGGFPAAETWVRKVFDERIRESRENDGLQDYKTHLQEVVQARFKSAPKYDVVQALGPDHDKTFEIELRINGLVAAKASGKSKKDAEQNAAKIALAALETPEE